MEISAFPLVLHPTLDYASSVTACQCSLKGQRKKEADSIYSEMLFWFLFVCFPSN